MVVPPDGNEVEWLRCVYVVVKGQTKVFVDKIDVVNRLKYRIVIKTSQKQAAQLVVDDNFYKYVTDVRIQKLHATLEGIFSGAKTIELSISKYDEYTEEIKLYKFKIRGNEITPKSPRPVIRFGKLKYPREILLVGANIVRRDLVGYMCDLHRYNSSHLGFFHHL
jgi:hypothetical protein